MKLAVSSIGWTNDEEPAVAEKMRELGVDRVEIAPTKLWDDPTKASIEDIRAYVAWWAKYGIKVAAFQSMLFSRPDLLIFGTEDNRRECIEYLKDFLKLASEMDAKVLVFGSPKNRQRNDMQLDEANRIATDFFKELGNEAVRYGVSLCIEPNAAQYNCDFIVNASEGRELVENVASEGFKLHLDTACMALAGDDMRESILSSRDVLEHFHISSPMLGQVEKRDDVDHQSAAAALHEIGYDKLVSIEMRPGEMGTNVERVEKAIRFAQQIYGV